MVVSGSGATYTVTINGIAGAGTLGLTLLDDGTFRDGLGKPLQKLTTPLFQTNLTFGVGSNPIAVSSADFNGDGKADLVVANFYSSSVSVMLRKRERITFTAGQTFATTAFPSSIATADVNGDGRQDIVTANLNSNRLSVLLGNGDGTFPRPTDAGDAIEPRVGGDR